MQQLLREAPVDGPRTRTTSPSTSGTSVLALKYKDGVMLAADTFGSYGSLAMFKNLTRLHAVNTTTVIGASGDVSDYQAITKLLDQLAVQEFTFDDGAQLQPAEVHSYLSRVMYNRRSRVDPLWNTVLVAGWNPTAQQSFLGCVDIYGSNYLGDFFATGYGQHMAIPLLRDQWRADLTFDEAKTLLESCLRVLYYRDARAANRFQLATITAAGPSISAPYTLDTQWQHKRFVEPRVTAFA